MSLMSALLWIAAALGVGGAGGWYLCLRRHWRWSDALHRKSIDLADRERRVTDAESEIKKARDLLAPFAKSSNR